MAKEDLSDFNSDSGPEGGESSEKLSEEEEEEDEEPRNMAKQVIPDYEKQRLSRMAENKARMEALGLRKMASSFMTPPQKSNHSRISSQRKGKRKLVDEDDDYKPNADVSADDQDDDDEDKEEDEDLKSSSKSRRKKPQNKGTKPKNKLPLQKHSRSTGYSNEDDDEELMQAISLSLQDLPEKKNANIPEGAGRKKKSFNSRVQMTEDELILHFFQFDESGKGFLTVRDLERVSIAHDFIWTDKELADMINCFDSDGDGKLSLDDFRKIAGRCNMI
ncbi:probable calcium-binding protein CML17 [Euphorbia lathyris]|uniref:probable calcium-binding protein CML17 n=1 Tax=Euphorbia lathyris TaxID=212925 RepID=UPI003313392F